MEESIDGWVSGDKASGHYLGTEPVEQLYNWQLQREIDVADVMATFENWLDNDTIDCAKSIWWQLIHIISPLCIRTVKKVQKNAKRETISLKTELGQPATIMASSHLPAFPSTNMIFEICWVLNGDNDHVLTKQLTSSYADVTHWDDLNDFVQKMEDWKRNTASEWYRSATWSRITCTESIQNFKQRRTHTWLHIWPDCI